jgi:anhydro-N-acetylmuramic acid kinase
MTPKEEPARFRLAIGAISGTSMDGIDVALVETDGEGVARQGPGATYAYPAATRESLLRLLSNPEAAELDPLRELEADVTEAHAEAIEKFIADFALEPREVAVVGLHGQTVLHRPERRFTRQLGDPAAVARRLGIDTVGHFRHADVAAGGQGAPFAPLYHRALASGLEHPVMVLNLGGVGNVTYIDGEFVTAFDTGPASALLDDFMAARRGVAFDKDGALAAEGEARRDLVDAFMANPFFARKPPKSLDRNDFHGAARSVEGLPDAEGAATLAAFTVAASVAALDHVPRPPERWLVCGGGRLNQSFMQGLREALVVPVDPVEAVGWNGDYLEAQCFGFLAVRALEGLPLSLPATTGVPHPMPGGELYRASA